MHLIKLIFKTAESPTHPPTTYIFPPEIQTPARNLATFSGDMYVHLSVLGLYVSTALMCDML